MDLAWYKGRRVFVTGHTGFKGAWLCRVLRHAGAQVYGYALAPPEGENLFGLCVNGGEIGHSIGDVRNFDALRAAFEAARPEVVLHLAAQPLVREGYKDPRGTYETNVLGTLNLMECVRLWPQPLSVVNVTTDKVYRNREWEWGYREDDVLDGYDPYSGSKSCSELVTAAYRRSFFCESGAVVSTARAGNVIGGGDFASDRIVPDCFAAARAGREIELRNPGSTRPYQHVLEPLLAYLLLAQKQAEAPALAGSYNIGPGDEGCASTARLAELFCAAWGEGLSWRAAGDGGPHEAGFLRLDCSRAGARLGWHARWSLETAMGHTVALYRRYLSGGNIAALMDEQIAAYLEGESDV